MGATTKLRNSLIRVLGIGALLVTGAAAGTVGAAASNGNGHAWGNARVCTDATPGTAVCEALVRTDPDTHAAARNSSPAGYGPTQLRTAYGLTGTTTGHPVVAIVDADGDSHAYSDLTTYRNYYGLSAMPLCSASSLTTKTCFAQVGETGSTRLPRDNMGWDEEQALDIDMVSAGCPQCSILLVDANSASWGDLAAAENEAVVLGANVVSNSYGGSGEATLYASSYSHAGVAIVASSGDSGYQNTPSSPASYPSVVAAGGTSLTSVSPRVESAWNDAGSYCSTNYAMPTWQQGVVSGCTMRGVADVSSDADPNTGVAVYDQGWYVFGGTSVSSPFISSVIADAGNWASFGTNGASYIYSHKSSLNDVTSGKNGSCTTALCVAGAGWDGPTGLGSPNGTGAL